MLNFKNAEAESGLNNKTLDSLMSVKMLDAEGEFEGYASVFDDIDQGNDVVMKGAFKKSLRDIKRQKRLVPMLWQHQTDEPIGFYKSIEEDDRGLKVHGVINLKAGPLEKRAYEHLKMGSLGGMSIGYRMLPGTYEYDEAERVTRLKVIDLREISLVTMPMLLSARVTGVKKGIMEIRERLEKGERLSSRDWEKLIRDDLGLSLSQAKAAVAANSLGKDGLRDSNAEKNSEGNVLNELASILST